MKIVVINSSPHPHGNTTSALNSFLEPLHALSPEIVTYNLVQLKYRGCIGCNGCHKTGHCVLKDDITALYQDYDSADIVIVASPIYFLTVTSYLKAAIDRTQAIWASKYILRQPIIDRKKKRYGVFIATAGASLNANASLAVRPIIKMYFDSINTDYTAEIIIYNTDIKPLGDDKEQLTTITENGRQLIKDILIT